MPSIAGVVAGLALVAALVVAGQSRHEFLRVVVSAPVGFVGELGGLPTPQHGRDLAPVGNDDVAVVALGPVEALGCCHGTQCRTGA